MDKYQILITAATSTVVLLSSIKALFGKSIDKMIETKRRNKQEELAIKKELVSIKHNFGHITEILEDMKDQIKDGHELDILFMQDRDKVASLIEQNDIQECTILAIKEGILAITKDRLLYLIKRYIANGCISVTDFENIQSLFSAYESLGGNHIVTQLMKDINKLPKKK